MINEHDRRSDVDILMASDAFGELCATIRERLVIQRIHSTMLGYVFYRVRL
jgi:hypothetical protein